MNSHEYDNKESNEDNNLNGAKAAIGNEINEATTVVSRAFDKTVSAVGDGIEVGKQYIADQHLEKFADEFSSVVKKYPLQSMFVGIGVGVLISNTFSRR